MPYGLGCEARCNSSDMLGSAWSYLSVDKESETVLVIDLLDGLRPGIVPKFSFNWQVPCCSNSNTHCDCPETIEICQC